MSLPFVVTIDRVVSLQLWVKYPKVPAILVGSSWIHIWRYRHDCILL